MPITQARMESLVIAAQAFLDAYNAAVRAIQDAATRGGIDDTSRAILLSAMADAMGLVPPEAIEVLKSEAAWIRMTKHRNAYTKEYMRAKRDGTGRTRQMAPAKVQAPKARLAAPLEAERLPPARADQMHRPRTTQRIDPDVIDAAIDKSYRDAIAQGMDPVTMKWPQKNPDILEVTIEPDPDVATDLPKGKPIF